jgi:hypothetical protein
MDDDGRSPLRRAVIKLVSLIGAGAIIIGVNAWLDWEPPKDPRRRGPDLVRRARRQCARGGRSDVQSSRRARSLLGRALCERQSRVFLLRAPERFLERVRYAVRRAISRIP